MKLTCPECGHRYEGTISQIGKPATEGAELQWLSICPHCNTLYPVEVAKRKIIMLFAYNDPKFFTDDFDPKNPIIAYYSFHTPKPFLEKWKKIVENPDSMWYWVLYDEKCICSGACDPNDIDLFKEFFTIQQRINRAKPKYEKIRKELEAIRTWLGPKEEIDPNSVIGFEWDGLWVVNPFFDATWGFPVDPIRYYGVDNIKVFIEKANAKRLLPTKQ